MTKAAQAMKKAWEIFKSAGIKTSEAWSNALRQAWAIVKGVVIEAGMKFVVESRGILTKINGKAATYALYNSLSEEEKNELKKSFTYDGRMAKSWIVKEEAVGDIEVMLTNKDIMSLNDFIKRGRKCYFHKYVIEAFKTGRVTEIKDQADLYY